MEPRDLGMSHCEGVGESTGAGAAQGREGGRGLGVCVLLELLEGSEQREKGGLDSGGALG